MAKEKKDDIKFDKLQGLNLKVESNIDDIKPVKEEKKGRVGRKAKNTSARETIKTSFKIEKDLHLALKQYSLLEGEDMADIVFERVLKPFLEKKGYYPPKKK